MAFFPLNLIIYVKRRIILFLWICRPLLSSVLEICLVYLTMGDSENSLPPSKKRAAGREISKDDPGLDDEEDSGEQETGTFKRASEEVLATRRIVKVRRNTTATSSNPFAGIRLVAPSVPTPAPAQVPSEEVATSGKAAEDVKNDVSEESGKCKEENCDKTENKIDESVSDAAVDKESAADKENVEKLEDDKPGNEKAEGEEARSEDKKEGGQADNEDKKDNGNENVNASSEGAPLSSFQQLSSSKNAFTGLAGTGLSTSTFSFGSIPKDGSSDASSTPLFGQKSDQPSFGFGLSTNGSSSLFGTAGSSIASKSEGSGFPSLQEVPVETGEENERVAFSADSVMFEFFDGSWKERGKGEVKVNVSTSGTERARLVMRARGNYRLILNASLYPDMKLTNMDKKGITFACINSISEGKDGLSTFALKFKDIAIVDEFCRVVTEHKGKTGSALKTPENSPKASDE